MRALLTLALALLAGCDSVLGKLPTAPVCTAGYIRMTVTKPDGAVLHDSTFVKWCQ